MKSKPLTDQEYVYLERPKFIQLQADIAHEITYERYRGVVYKDDDADNRVYLDDVQDYFNDKYDDVEMMLHNHKYLITNKVMRKWCEC